MDTVLSIGGFYLLGWLISALLVATTSAQLFAWSVLNSEPTVRLVGIANPAVNAVGIGAIVYIFGGADWLPMLPNIAHLGFFATAAAASAALAAKARAPYSR
jgi:hypothetical protein